MLILNTAWAEMNLGDGNGLKREDSEESVDETWLPKNKNKSKSACCRKKQKNMDEKAN